MPPSALARSPPSSLAQVRVTSDFGETALGIAKLYKQTALVEMIELDIEARRTCCGRAWDRVWDRVCTTPDLESPPPEPEGRIFEEGSQVMVKGTFSGKWHRAEVMFGNGNSTRITVRYRDGQVSIVPGNNVRSLSGVRSVQCDSGEWEGCLFRVAMVLVVVFMVGGFYVILHQPPSVYVRRGGGSRRRPVRE